jgi:hypothetical protein
MLTVDYPVMARVRVLGVAYSGDVNILPRNLARQRPTVARSKRAFFIPKHQIF